MCKIRVGVEPIWHCNWGTTENNIYIFKMSPSIPAIILLTIVNTVENTLCRLTKESMEIIILDNYLFTPQPQTFTHCTYIKSHFECIICVAFAYISFQ